MHFEIGDILVIFVAICPCRFGSENRAMAVAAACKRRCNQSKITLQFFTCVKTQLLQHKYVQHSLMINVIRNNYLCDLQSEHVLKIKGFAIDLEVVNDIRNAIWSAQLKDDANH